MDILLGLSSQPRGLHNFISDIRSATNKEDERKRVDQELANIRQKFTNSSTLSSYQKKKYVWKMCYIYMLGYDVDFGHFEFISLISSAKYSEKSVGYMAVSLMVRPGDELFNLAVNSMRNDLVGGVHYSQSLALSTIANLGGPELAEAISTDVARLAAPPSETIPSFIPPGSTVEYETRNRSAVTKKACLCLNRFFKDNPDCVPADEWVRRSAKLLEDRDVGVVLSALSLVTSLASHSPSLFEPVVPYVISVLSRLVLDRTCSVDYLYYRTPCPWAIVKALKFMQLYACPVSNDGKLLTDVLTHIFERTEVTENINKSNADHALLFEAVNLVILYGADASSYLKEASNRMLARFIETKDANVRYLGLDAMSKLAKLDGAKSVQSSQLIVLEALTDLDISVRKRALHLLFLMTDQGNAADVVGELVSNLSVADTVMKEEIVVKVAILAEQFSGEDWKWYVDTLRKVVLVAGDYVAEQVWHRVVHVVTNHPEIHEYAALKMCETAQNKYANEVSVSLAAYLLGEIGVNVCEQPGMSGYDQFAALHQHFAKCTTKTQAVLLTSYAKLFNLYPDTRDIIGDVFNKYSSSAQLELQQRSCEYLALPKVSSEVMETVLNTMPALAADKSSSLTALLASADNSSSSAGKDKPVAVVANRKPGSSSSSSSSASSSSAQAAPEPKIDLLSLDDNDVAFSGHAVGVPSEVQPKCAEWVKSALLTPNGQKVVLYDDDLLRLTIISEVKLHQGRIAFAIYNKTGADMADFKFVVPEAPALVFKVVDPTGKIPASGDGRAQISFECKRPFSDEPSFDVSFSVGVAPYTYSLKLPLLPFCFQEALPTSDKETYMGRWKSIGGENGLEVQEIFTSSKPVTPQLMGAIRQNIAGPLWHLGPAAGLDNDMTVTGSASFRTGTAGPDGNLIAVGVMLRIEGDAAQNRFRITVRAKHAVIAQATKYAVKLMLQ